MDDEQLQQIANGQNRRHRGHGVDAEFIAHAREDILPALLADRGALLAEVERLRAYQMRLYGLTLFAAMQKVQAENAALTLREIVRAIAPGFTLVYDEQRNAHVCALCDAEIGSDFGLDSGRDMVGWYEQHIQHTSDCPVTKARAILAEHSEHTE